MRPFLLVPVLIGGAFATLAFQSQDTIAFDLKDPKGVTGLNISIDAPLEPVKGFANGVSGNLSFNLKNPEKSTGKIVIDAASTHIGSDNMTSAMHQAWCLDVAKYPTIEFAVTKVNKITKAKDGTFDAKVTGNFSFHGITKPLTVDAKLKYLPGKLKARGGVEKDGDLLQVHSKFSILRSDFDLAPDLSTDLIGNKIDIDLAATGVAIR